MECPECKMNVPNSARICAYCSNDLEYLSKSNNKSDVAEHKSMTGLAFFCTLVIGMPVYAILYFILYLDGWKYKTFPGIDAFYLGLLLPIIPGLMILHWRLKSYSGLNDNDYMYEPPKSPLASFLLYSYFVTYPILGYLIISSLKID